ncbi:MAG TPA: pseudouridine synthase [Spirochaetia bacterium]|nr:pseudouridine synthase [Spirochaetia bacterium]
MLSNDTKHNEKPLRLQVFLSRSGIASRRACEEFIAQGLVKVNGKTVTEQGFKVGDSDEVTFRGKRVFLTHKMFYVALNKPPMYLCSNSDPKGRPLAIDLLKGAYPVRLFSVGRLDFLSSGLILFSNDGDFARRITHPSCQIEKEYLVETKDPITVEMLEELKKGIYIDGERYTIKSYTLKNSRSANIVLTEGKNREIRNIFLFKRIGIRRLQRVRIGNILLGKLPEGQHRPLSEKEIAGLKGLIEKNS